MFLGNPDRKSGAGAFIGYDISDRFAQISFWLPGADKPETLSQVMGEEEYMIPAVLCRRRDRDVWTYGREALKNAEAGQGILVENMLSKALAGESVEVEGECFDAAVLLSLFIKRSLSLLAGAMQPEKAAMFLFTVDEVDKQTVEVLSRVAALISLPPDRVSCQSRGESFFYYNINQPEELWRHQVMICDFSGTAMKLLMFEMNHHTRPVTVMVHEEIHPEIGRRLPPEEGPGDGDKQIMDERFASVLEKVCAGKIIDTIYLIGDGFNGEWYVRSLPVLCRGRRVFQGNNLYSKGACYGARAKKQPGEDGRTYVYLGKDMLKANIGLEASFRGQDSYFALLDAGINWYDAVRECDFLLNEDHAFSLRITPLNGREVKEVAVTLDGVPERPPRTTRIHLTVSLSDADTVRLKMEDRGFGEMFPASHKIWEETFRLKEEKGRGRKEGEAT